LSTVVVLFKSLFLAMTQQNCTNQASASCKFVLE